MASRYQYIPITKNNTGKRYFTTNIYPEIPADINDIYIITTITDRLDVLAYDFYGDTTLYWIISMANNLPGDSLVPIPGTQLRIPTNIQSVINQYNNLNQNR
jgi:hypothetical protein